MEVKERELKSVDTLDLNGEDKVKINVNVGLENKARSDIASKLSTVLSDTYVLLIKTQCYHWNVRGNQFYGIHHLTEQQYNNIFQAIDDIAERIRSLGFDAPGTIREFQSFTTLDEAKKGLSQHEMIADLVKNHEEISKSIDHAKEVADKGRDDATSDLMIERLRFHQKAAWMWRSLLER